MKLKRRPKQNFSINYGIILDSDLSKSQKDILIAILMHHKKNCKYEYTPLYNSAICKKLEIGKDSFSKHRQTLIDNNYINPELVQKGKVRLIQYRFNWAKLLKLKFIIPIEKSEYAPKFIKKDKLPFKNGYVLSNKDISKLKVDTIYKVKRYRLDNDSKRKGNGVTLSQYGKELIKMINISEIQKDAEYVINK